MKWLARLKTEKSRATYASKPGQPSQGGGQHGFLGSLAYLPAPFQKYEHSESEEPTSYAANDAAMSDPDRCCWPHSPAMNSAELETCAARLVRFTDKGESLDDAERLVDRLLIRDREGDNRRLCLECAHLHGAGRWRCGNWRQAEIGGSAMQEELVLTLQRCNGFT